MRNRSAFLGLTWDTKKSFWKNYHLIRNNKTLHFAHKLASELTKFPKIMSKAMRKDRSVVLSLAEHVVSVFDTVATFVENVGDNFFNSNGWVAPFSTDFSAIIYDMYRSWQKTLHDQGLSSSGEQESEHSVSRKKIAFIEIAPGIEIGWEELALFQVAFYAAPVKIYCAPENVLAVKEIVAKHLWERFKDASVIIMKRVNRKSLNDNDDYEHSSTSYLSFTEDDVHSVASSAKTEQIVSNYRRALDVGLHRSLMLEGPPGTGKSTMAQAVVKKLNLKALRVCVEDIDEKFIPSIKESVQIFKPGALIIDDFDRASFDVQHALLELAEWLSAQLKVTVVTVNDKNALDQALLRPGRFDEIVTIRTMDEGAVRALLGEYADEAYEFVKDWPIAFIMEYRKRRMYCDEAEAKQSMEELRTRVERLFQAYDENEEEAPFIGKRGRK